jgi:hypothetical protein
VWFVVARILQLMTGRRLGTERSFASDQCKSTGLWKEVGKSRERRELRRVGGTTRRSALYRLCIYETLIEDRRDNHDGSGEVRMGPSVKLPPEWSHLHC